MMTIDEKAKELYEKRIAPYASHISDKDKENIIEFQKLIFCIDEYGENTKEIDRNILNSFWLQAEDFLDNLHIPKDIQTILLHEVKDYADIETATRSGKRLIDYDIELFYRKKSCDVRMQRHLIRYLNNEPPQSTNQEIMKDIVEEIEDDIDDVEEDKTTSFNGNRFLEAKTLSDAAKLEEYRAFVGSLQNVPNDLRNRVINKLNLLI